MNCRNAIFIAINLNLRSSNRWPTAEIVLHGRHTPSVLELRGLPLCVPCERTLGNNAARVEKVKQDLATLPAKKTTTHSLNVLTPRQRELVGYVRLGMSNAEIGMMMGLGEQVVKNVLGAVMDRLGLENRVKVAVYGATWDC